jgi:hypothetical protein
VIARETDRKLNRKTRGPGLFHGIPPGCESEGVDETLGSMKVSMLRRFRNQDNWEDWLYL